MGNSALFHGRIRSETSSTCSTEAVTAAHNFEVRDYPLLQGVGISNAVSSSVFRVGGYDWKIEFYPDGLALVNGKSRCVVTVIHQPRTVRRRKLILATQPTLRESLEHMLKAGEGEDVTFSVGDQLFNAHRCVLASRSPVFKAELIGPMKEAATRCIKVDDMEPETLEALLHFIYTDDMLDDDDDEGKTDRSQHLLVAADRYSSRTYTLRRRLRLIRCAAASFPSGALQCPPPSLHRRVRLVRCAAASFPSAALPRPPPSLHPPPSLPLRRRLLCLGCAAASAPFAALLPPFPRTCRSPRPFFDLSQSRRSTLPGSFTQRITMAGPYTIEDD
ncbi:hypothetical protein QYE76_046393 [Lolium multiflorum]|uniref:BTB domain-containing protein n=1 Tax=Lolium multiflorum TaxID=4521 RepID=A0AAD8WYL1_LOLMU|nr:hypothetical protein QYE76_046393 [Lolium multiflorum]